MPDEKLTEQKLADQKLSDEELDGVAGGTREEFNEICGLLGKSSTWNTRDGIRKYLMKNYSIEVTHWNTGDRGSKKNAPAEFYYVAAGGRKYDMSFDEVKGLITGKITPEDITDPELINPYAK